MNRHKSTTGLFSLLFVTGIAATAQNSAVIKGTAVDSATGKPVSGAVVIATKQVKPSTGGVARSGADGSFQISALSAGIYKLSTQVPKGGYLATWEWGNAAATVTLATGQTSAGNTVKLKPSSTLKIHVDDAGQMLSKKANDGYFPDLLMGVSSSGKFYPAHPVKNSGAVEYQLEIPFDTSLNLSVQSQKLVLGDSTGKPLPNNIDQQSFQHSSSEGNHVSFVYKVLSVKQ